MLLVLWYWIAFTLYAFLAWLWFWTLWYWLFIAALWIFMSATLGNWLFLFLWRLTIRFLWFFITFCFSCIECLFPFLNNFVAMLIDNVKYVFYYITALAWLTVFFCWSLWFAFWFFWFWFTVFLYAFLWLWFTILFLNWLWLFIAVFLYAFLWLWFAILLFMWFWFAILFLTMWIIVFHLFTLTFFL